jgi:hypothetical protein
MLAVPLSGCVLIRLESIGVRRLADLRGRDPWDLMQINLEAGGPIWRPPLAVRGLRNLLDGAAQEAAPSRAPEHG